MDTVDPFVIDARVGAQPFGLRVVHARIDLPQKANDLLFAVFTWFACPSFPGLMDFLEI